MKTKTSKRLLSVLLAVMMVATSLPITAISAFGDSTTEAAETAMAAFEDKISSATTAYIGIEDAYEAYVACQEELDAYVYGGETSGLSSATSALNNAVDAMTEFSVASSDEAATANGTVPTFATSTTSDMSSYAGEGFSNLLYSPDTATEQASGTTANVTCTAVYATDTVLLYDGVNDTMMPVMASAIVTDSKTRYLYSAYPSDSSGNDVDGIALINYWMSGGGADANWNWNWWSGMYNGVTYSAGYNYATGYYGNQSTNYRSNQLAYSTSWGSFKSATIQYQSNVLKVTEEPDGYSETYTPYWYFGTGNSANSDTGIYETSNPITVINYKAVTDAIDTAVSTLASLDMSDYSEGGLSDYIAAFEAAVDFDPYDTSVYFGDNGNSTDEMVSDIETICTNLSSATYMADSDAYQALRDAIDTDGLVTVYNAGNDDSTYTTESWEAFVAAYDDAVAAMAAVNDGSGYAGTETDIQNLADDLVAAFEALETVETKVDASALITAISQFTSMLNIFTDESYSAAEAVIDAAKEAVWGSVDNYRVSAELLADSEESQATVLAQTQAVYAAIASLRISPDAVVTVTLTDDDGNSVNYKYSLNEAMALADSIENPSYYGDYATLVAEIAEAQTYAATLDSTDLTDFDAQYAEYVQYIADILEIYYALYPNTILAWEDGIVIQDTTKAITTITSMDNSVYQTVDFSYPGKTYVIRTTHDDLSVNTGTAEIVFGGNAASVDNNMLDSISIHATADPISGQASKNYIGDTQNSWSSKPNAMTSDELETYAGCLSYNGYSLENLRYVGEENNNQADDIILTLEDGTEITDEVTARNTDLTDVLGTTNGGAYDPGRGGIFAKSGDNSVYAYTYIDADMMFESEGSAEMELTADTKPTFTTYAMNSNGSSYFGTVSIFNVKNTFNYAGYMYMTSYSSGSAIDAFTYVIDASYLFDLIDLVTPLVSAESAAKYTDDTYSKFTKYYNEAIAELDYNDTDNDLIDNKLITRYNNLWNYYQALTLKTFDITFSYKDADGNDATTSFTATYGDTLNDYTDTINTIALAESYVEDGYTYTFEGWDTDVDMDAAITSEATYTAVYSSVLNLADWTAYNEAKNDLLNKALQDNVYTVDALTSLNTKLSTLTYYYYTADEQAEVYADEQTDIDTETAALIAYADALTEAGYDASAAVAAAASEDEDRYSADVTWNETVTVLDGDEGTEVLGLKYDTQDELDSALADALSIMSYDIYLNGEVIAENVDYGTELIVNSDGTYELNVADTHVDYDGQSVAWTYSYAAPSTDYEQSIGKYMCSAPSFGFILKGDTYLTTVDSSEDDAIVVTFKSNLADNSTKTYAVCYADENGVVEAPTAPNYAYYTYTGYTLPSAAANNGDGTFTVTSDCTITANYSVKDTETFEIHLWWEDSYEISKNYDGRTIETEDFTAEIKTEYEYNEKVTYITFDFLVYENDADPDEANYYLFLAGEVDDPTTWTLLDTDGTYQFYAYMDMDIVAVDYWDLDVYFNKYSSYADVPYTPNVISNSSAVPIYNSSGTLDKISLVGTYVLQSGYTLVEAGYLFTTQSDADLTVDNVGTDGITRMKSTNHTVGNQFVINVKTTNMASDTTFEYCAYAILKDPSGAQVIYYSPTYSDELAKY